MQPKMYEMKIETQFRSKKYYGQRIDLPKTQEVKGTFPADRNTCKCWHFHDASAPSPSSWRIIEHIRQDERLFSQWEAGAARFWRLRDFCFWQVLALSTRSHSRSEWRTAS